MGRTFFAALLRNAWAYAAAISTVLTVVFLPTHWYWAIPVGVALLIVIGSIQTTRIANREAMQLRAENERLRATPEPDAPFVRIKTRPRQYEEAVLNMNDIVGTRVVHFQEGQAVIENIGNGPALNVHYEMRPTQPTEGNIARPAGYVDSVPSNREVVLPIPNGVFSNNRYEFVASYESVSGRQYRTTIRIDDSVVTVIRRLEVSRAGRC